MSRDRSFPTVGGLLRVAGIVLAASVTLLSPVAAEGGYLATVQDATRLLSQGQIAEARRAFQRAREADMNDALAAVGLGYALDVEGKAAEARGELELALKLDGQGRACRWAHALVALNNARLDEAIQHLEAIRKEGAPTPELWVALAYARCASGDYAGAREALDAAGRPDQLGTATRSMASLVRGAVAYATGDYARAVEVLRDAARHLPANTYFDNVPSRRTPLLPEARTSRREALALVSASSLGPAVRTRSGVVRLHLDPFRFPGASYAFFLVDGKTVHGTNAPPFRYDWDTRRVRNGYHKVVVRAEDSMGEVLGQTEEVFLIHNEGVTCPPAYPEEEYTRADEALSRAMILQPDVMATRYLLGLALKHMGRVDEAAAELEQVMAHDPDYGRARQELRSIYAAGAGSRLRSVSSVPISARKVAITFDDGPHPLYTPPLLDLLERYQARCTMFLVGSQAESHPEIVREIAEKGHKVANHTYSHPNLRTLDPRGIERELLRGRSVLQRISGKKIRLFRPPGGNADRTVEEIAAGYGLTTVYWDLFDSWLQRYDEATVLQKLLGGIKPGSIVLLHNGSNKTAPILEPFFEELTRQGYQLVTVSELLAEAAPGIQPPTEVEEAPELRDEEPAAPAAPETAPAHARADARPEGRAAAP